MIRWTEEAERLLGRVPFFVRGMVKRRVERWAYDKGIEVITEELFRRAKEELVGDASRVNRGFSVEGCMGCRHRVTDSRGLMDRMEELLKGSGITEFLLKATGGELKHHNQFRVALSECPNSCSRVHIADFGLQGRVILEVNGSLCDACGRCVDACVDGAVRCPPLEVDGSLCLACGECARVCPSGALSFFRTGYRVLVGGKLGRRPRLAQELVSFATADEVLSLLGRVLRVYMEYCEKGERLGAVIERMGWERFCSLVL